MMYLFISSVMSIILTIFAIGVMSYLSMATPIGPWIAPTIVLCAFILFKIFNIKKHQTESLALIAVSSSVGGIVATACGFSFPTLYFIDPELFSSWMANPYFFCAALAGLVLAAGMLGIWIANIFEQKLLVEQQLPFPIGQLVYKMIAASQQIQKAYELLYGFCSSLLFSFLQDGGGPLPGVIPKTITLISAHSFGMFSLPLLKFDLWPLLWAVGFVAGSVIAIPLFVGALAKIFIIDPINLTFFSAINNVEFLLAFCSGMVISGAILGFLISPKDLITYIKNIKNIFGSQKIKSLSLSREYVMQGLIMVIMSSIFLLYFQFSLFAIAYLLITAAICSYQIAMIAGKIGLAQLGRWATFVMVPALFLFKLNAVQIVFIATFVEIAGGVAADVLFGRKIAQEAAISKKRIMLFQYFGLLITALSIGIIFWLLISHFHLGSEQLFAQRAQARQLLLSVKSFNYLILLLGLGFGFLLKFLKFNPTLVLGGLLMPLNISVGLIAGGLISLIVPDKEKQIPFWSGVFAAGCIWMLIRSIF